MVATGPCYARHSEMTTTTCVRHVQVRSLPTKPFTSSVLTTTTLQAGGCFITILQTRKLTVLLPKLPQLGRAMARGSGQCAGTPKFAS